MIGILHNIRSIHNVGSIFRTADAAGVKKLYLTGITPTPLDRFGNLRPQFAKVSLGAEATVPWEHYSKIDRLLKVLNKEHVTLLALEQSRRSISYTEFCPQDLDVPIALIIGNEVKGLPPALLKRCDTILEIPMHGAKESLNVAVAFGIVAFHLAQVLPKVCSRKKSS